MLQDVPLRQLLSIKGELTKAKTTMGDKSVETLSNKIQFLSILVTFSPFPPRQCWFFYFFDCTDHSAYTTLNWGAGSIRELTLQANKIEQMLKYRKASFPKSVSTTFVAHWRLPCIKWFKFIDHSFGKSNKTSFKCNLLHVKFIFLFTYVNAISWYICFLFPFILLRMKYFNRQSPWFWLPRMFESSQNIQTSIMVYHACMPPRLLEMSN